MALESAGSGPGGVTPSATSPSNVSGGSGNDGHVAETSANDEGVRFNPAMYTSERFATEPVPLSAIRGACSAGAAVALCRLAACALATTPGTRPSLHCLTDPEPARPGEIDGGRC